MNRYFTNAGREEKMTFRRQIDARIVNPLVGTEAIPAPSYATSGSAGMDLRACMVEPVVLCTGQTKLFKTGIAIDMRDPNIACFVVPRSGLALKHSLSVLNSPGTIDSDYTGEIGVILVNHGETDYTVQPGERIAQMIFMPVIQAELSFVDEFRSQTERGSGGFGSTGKT
jgi:dUTP pyrophosphatase